MTVSFDTLSFAKRLTEAGEKPAVAEAHAMALKEFVMDAIATKADISDLGRSIGEEIQDVRDEIADVRVETRGELAMVRSEVADLRGEMRGEFAKVRSEISGLSERFASKDELRHEVGLLRKDIDAMGLKLTVRMGGMLAVAVGAVGAVGAVATLGKVV